MSKCSRSPSPVLGSASAECHAAPLRRMCMHTAMLGSLIALPCCCPTRPASSPADWTWRHRFGMLVGRHAPSRLPQVVPGVLCPVPHDAPARSYKGLYPVTRHGFQEDFQIKMCVVNGNAGPNGVHSLKNHHPNALLRGHCFMGCMA